MKLKFITSNQYKFEELQTQLQPLDIDVELFPMTYPEIQADTMYDVARFSLSVLIPSIKGNFMIEDAGLAIDILNGFPGPYSSFVLSTLGNDGILNVMSDKENRSAEFISVIGLYWEGEMNFFRGTCKGRIIHEKRGDEGFGFDPIFAPEGSDETFAELSIKEKTSISHRSRSTNKLIDFLKNKLDKVD